MNRQQFIEQHPDPSGIEGMSVYACAVHVAIPGDVEYVLGETAAYVWNTIEDYQLEVLAVAYAGDDRNYARELANTANYLYRQKGVATLSTALALIRAVNWPEQIAPYERRLVRPRLPLPRPGNGSEAEMERATRLARQAETEPPDFEAFPPGTLSCTQYGGECANLVELRQYRLSDPRLRLPEGEPDNPTVVKYVRWINAGRLPPPLRGYELASGDVSIADGHHRAAALRLAGIETTQVWVAMTQVGVIPIAISLQEARRWAEQIPCWPRQREAVRLSLR